jgi:hypothetical protein
MTSFLNSPNSRTPGGKAMKIYTHDPVLVLLAREVSSVARLMCSNFGCSYVDKADQKQERISNDKYYTSSMAGVLMILPAIFTPSRILQCAGRNNIKSPQQWKEEPYFAVAKSPDAVKNLWSS